MGACVCVCVVVHDNTTHARAEHTLCKILARTQHTQKSVCTHTNMHNNPSNTHTHAHTHVHEHAKRVNI